MNLERFGVQAAGNGPKSSRTGMPIGRDGVLLGSLGGYAKCRGCPTSGRTPKPEIDTLGRIAFAPKLGAFKGHA